MTSLLYTFIILSGNTPQLCAPLPGTSVPVNIRRAFQLPAIFEVYSMSRNQNRVSIPEILLFNINSPEKHAAIRLIALRLELRCRAIPDEMQSCTIRELLYSQSQPSGQPVFTDEMLIMYALPASIMHEFLDELHRHGQFVRLKAVVTETNISWTAAQLHNELLSEEEAVAKWKQNRRK